MLKCSNLASKCNYNEYSITSNNFIRTALSELSQTSARIWRKSTRRRQNGGRVAEIQKL